MIDRIESTVKIFENENVGRRRSKIKNKKNKPKSQQRRDTRQIFH